MARILSSACFSPSFFVTSIQLSPNNKGPPPGIIMMRHNTHSIFLLSFISSSSFFAIPFSHGGGKIRILLLRLHVQTSLPPSCRTLLILSVLKRTYLPTPFILPAFTVPRPISYHLPPQSPLQTKAYPFTSCSVSHHSYLNVSHQTVTGKANKVPAFFSPPFYIPAMNPSAAFVTDRYLLPAGAGIICRLLPPLLPQTSVRLHKPAPPRRLPLLRILKVPERT